MSIDPNDIIPIGDLATVIPGQYDHVVVEQNGRARKALAPEVNAAAAHLQGVIDELETTASVALNQVVANAAADIAPALANIGYLPPVVFSSGLSVNSTRLTIERGGQVYAPLQSALPFTTTSTFNPAQWRLVQGVVRVDIDPYLNGGWYQPTDLDLTGVVDESAKVTAYLATYRRVRLPSTGNGSIKMRVTIPSGCSLAGAGAREFNRNALAWFGTGTLVVGRVDFTGQRECSLSDLSVDAFAAGINAVQGVNDQTEGHVLTRVNTRAANHGHLWEQNSARKDGRDGGRILAVDCNHFGGPNGFVSKMRDVTFVRCFAYDVTVQGHVAVSDNINGSGIFSRALRTKFIDCGGDGCNEGLRVYSRDHHSLNNANGVQPAKDIEWSGTHTNTNGRKVRTGDFVASATNGAFSRVLNEQVRIKGGEFSGSTYSAVRFENSARPVVAAGFFGSNGAGGGQHVEYGDAVYDPQITDDVRFTGAVAGDAASIIVNPVNAGTVVCTAKRSLIILRNTATTFVSAAFNQSAGQILRFFIDDTFSTVNISGVSHRGRGVVCSMQWDGSVWIDLGESSPLGSGEHVLGFTTALSIDFATPRARSVFVGLSSNASSISAAVPVCPIGTRFSARLKPSNAGGKGLAGWAAIFKWTDEITAPSNVADGKTLVLDWYWDGASLVAIGKATY